jgi:hypothetical protein
LCNFFSWLAGIAVVMEELDRIHPANPAQSFLGSGFVTDLVHWLAPYFLYGVLPRLAAPGLRGAGGPSVLGAGGEGVALADFLASGRRRVPR